jgi:hypothetical protein
MSPTAKQAAASAVLVLLTAGAVAGLVRPVPAPASPWAAPVLVARANAVLAVPHIVFRTLAPRRAHGRVAMVAVDALGSRAVSALDCLRVSFAADVGLCMRDETTDKAVTHLAFTFDRRFGLQHRITLNGIPVRARVSPHGRLGAVTTYAEEETPAGERLATESLLIDMASGRVIADLREFEVRTAGFAPLSGAIDIASPAFARDEDRVYATLSTPTQRYVVRGSIAARRFDVIAEGLWTEGLSPDETRLVAKRATGDRGRWDLVVLDLSDLSVRPLNQGERSVDDQVEWMDNDHVMYHDVSLEGTGIWALPVDGASPPRLLLPHAFSPALVR